MNVIVTISLSPGLKVMGEREGEVEELKSSNVPLRGKFPPDPMQAVQPERDEADGNVPMRTRVTWVVIWVSNVAWDCHWLQETETELQPGGCSALVAVETNMSAVVQLGLLPSQPFA